MSERADDVTVTLTAQSTSYSYDSQNGDAEPVDFDVSLVDPNGTVIEPERVRVTDRGFVDMSGQDRRHPVASDDGFTVRNGGQEFVYRLDDPTAGEWTLQVMPENTVGLCYEITHNEDN